jgi:hypothetical protein
MIGADFFSVLCHRTWCPQITEQRLGKWEAGLVDYLYFVLRIAHHARFLLPASSADQVARRVTAVPPHDELVGVLRPTRFLLAVEFFRFVEEF